MEQNQDINHQPSALPAERIRLNSKGVIFYAAVTFLLGVFALIMVILTHPISWLLLLISLAILYGFYLLTTAKRIEFDNLFVYIGSESRQEKIPLEKISAVRWWLVGGGKSLPILSNIQYRNAQDVHATTTFFLSMSSNSKLQTFIQEVQEKNPSVDVRMRGR